MPGSQSLIVYAGGGVALLYASKELDKLQTANFDQKIGVQIIQNALKVRGQESWMSFQDSYMFANLTCNILYADTCTHNCLQCWGGGSSSCRKAFGARKY